MTPTLKKTCLKISEVFCQQLLQGFYRLVFAPTASLSARHARRWCTNKQTNTHACTHARTRACTQALMHAGPPSHSQHKCLEKKPPKKGSDCVLRRHLLREKVCKTLVDAILVICVSSALRVLSTESAVLLTLLRALHSRPGLLSLLDPIVHIYLPACFMEALAAMQCL